MKIVDYNLLTSSGPVKKEYSFHSHTSASQDTMKMKFVLIIALASITTVHGHGHHSHHHLRTEEDEEVSGHRKLQNGIPLKSETKRGKPQPLRMQERVARLVTYQRGGGGGQQEGSIGRLIVAKEPMVFESLLTSTLTSTGI
jgi:hypothetical protein